MKKQNGRNRNKQVPLEPGWWKSDIMASLVVFLVALPLCLGIAMASGAPPMAGILSGVIGGVVVASLGGSPMLVSGPANGLIVLVLMITQQYGLAMLGVIVLAAGALQALAGTLRLGQVFRAIPPSIVHGLMTGFAVIIFASQFHVMLDASLKGAALEQLLAIPSAVGKVLFGSDGSHRAAALLGVLTIVVLLVWKPIVPRRLSFIPASLVAVAAATLVAYLGNLNVQRVTLPDKMLEALNLIDLSLLPKLLQWPILEMALVMAFLASTETLLSATAVDRLHQGPRTNYDRELLAQGIGNMCCGVVGAVPLTGVIIRSAANVAAGGKTRLASVLHGVWLLLFVVALPGVLAQVPTSSLAAVLVVAVFKLVDVKALREIWEHDKREIGIYAVTAGTIFFWGVLPGVVLGLALAVAKLLYTVGHLNIRVEHEPERNRTHLYLEGTAAFLSLPKLARTLESIPEGTELHVHMEQLSLIDHACLDLLVNWEQQHRATGGRLVLDWESLHMKFGRQVAIDRPQAAAAAQGPLATTIPLRHFQREGWQPLLKNEQ